MSSRHVREVVDLTRDDENRVRITRPVPQPVYRPLTTERITIVLSDSDDESSSAASTIRQKALRIATGKRQHSASLFHRTEQKTASPQDAPLAANIDVGGNKARSIDNESIGNTRLPSATTLNINRPFAQAQETDLDGNRAVVTALTKTVPSAGKLKPSTAANIVGQQLAPNPVNKQQVKVQLLRKPQRLHCTECTETGLECDGERPCSRCVEPGLECRYPGDPQPESVSIGNSEWVVKETSVSSKSNTKSRTSSSTLTTSHSDLPLPQTSTHNEVGTLTEEIATKQLSKGLLDCFPVTTYIPQTYDDTKKLIHTMRENLNMQREYWLQSELVQTVRYARHISPSPSATLKRNPFRKLIAETRQTSQNRGQQQKLSIVKAAARKPVVSTFHSTDLGFDPKQAVLPAYRSIGRPGTNFIARNVHTNKHLPYFPDEEEASLRNTRENDLYKKHRTGSLTSIDEVHQQLARQRACLERLNRWSASFLTLIDCLRLTLKKVIDWAQTNSRSLRVGACATCGARFRPAKPFKTGVLMSSQEVERCEWLHKAFLSTTGIHIWHFIEKNGVSEHTNFETPVREQRSSNSRPSLCAICCVPNCVAHGMYEDGDSDDHDVYPLIDDPETENNRRDLMIPDQQTPSSNHICGLYCTVGAEEMLYSDLWGVDDNGVLSGFHHKDFAPVAGHAGFEGTAPCSQSCFIKRKTRKVRKVQVRIKCPLSEQQKAFLETRTRLCGSSTRLPCSIARRLKITCSDAFMYLVDLHRSTASSHNHQKVMPINQGSRKNYEVKPPRYGDRTLKEPYLPCSHDGPCKKELGCSCAQRNLHCEFSCGCDGSCYRRFPGCTCEGNCFENAKCLCWKFGRECDPWVCKSCGVVEVLDPSNKYHEEIRRGRCRNNRTQLGLPARTFKGASQLQGWGLFAGEDMPKFTYVGEYKGEIITSGVGHEAERRALVYHQGALEYLFDLNTKQEVDGSKFGNKMRFINHAKDPKYINLRSNRQLVSGITRVSFWTNRDIKAGEELFYDYNYTEETTKHFWDIETAQNTNSLLPIAKPHLGKMGARQTNAAGLGSDEDSEDDNDSAVPSPPSLPAAVLASLSKRQPKRKRRAEDGESPVLDGPPVLPMLVPRRTVSSKSSSKPISRQSSTVGRTVDNKNDSDEDDDEYYEQDEPSAPSGSEAEVFDSDNEVLSGPLSKPRKKGRPRLTDRRRGGEAQRKAAITRRQNRQNAA